MKFKPFKAADAVLDRLRFPVMAQPKLDGVRGCYITNQFTARTLKTFKNRNLTDTLTRPELQGFDGELIYGGTTDRGLCGKTTGYCNSLHTNTPKTIPDWYIFDWVTEQTHALPYSKRYALAQYRVMQLQQQYPEDFYYLKLLPAGHIVNSIEEVIQTHEQFIATGYEGTVIRYLDAPHKSGRSTVNQSWFMRLKDVGMEEAVILDIVEAETNFNEATTNELGETERSSHKENKLGNGMLGALVVKTGSGEIITLGAGTLTHDERRDYWESPHNIIGRICTYKFMKYGELNTRRHPRFYCFRDEDL